MEKLEDVLSKTSALGEEEEGLTKVDTAALCPQARDTGAGNSFKSK